MTPRVSVNAEALRFLLEKIEHGDPTWGTCMLCQVWPDQPHDPDCPVTTLQAALAGAEAPGGAELPSIGDIVGILKPYNQPEPVQEGGEAALAILNLLARRSHYKEWFNGCHLQADHGMIADNLTRITAQVERLSYRQIVACMASLRAALYGAPPQPQPAAEAGEVERLRAALEALTHAAHGLSLGEDWNKGAAAKQHGYRAALLMALPAALAALAPTPEQEA